MRRAPLLRTGLALLAAMIVGGVLLVPGAAQAATGRPNPPLNVVWQVIPGHITVSWTSGGSDGGYPIDYYNVTCAATTGRLVLDEGNYSPGPAVFELPAGQLFRCALAAHDLFGFGAPAISGIIANSTPPRRAYVHLSVVGPDMVGLSMSVANEGGAPVSFHYACTSSDGGARVPMSGYGTGGSPGTVLPVTGFTRARTYSCVVKAFNVAGESARSGPSNAVVAPPGAPGAPTGVTFTPTGAISGSVAFVPSTHDGGSPVSSYTAVCESRNGGAAITATGPASPIAIGNLSPSRRYHCSVQAHSIWPSPFSGHTDWFSTLGIAPLGGVTAVAVGPDGHTCAVTGGGAVSCWGNNQSGQLGDGTTSTSLYAVDVVGLSGATGVSAGLGFSCALMTDTSVRCWGTGAGGGTATGPMTVPGLSGVTSIASGSGHTCALLVDHTVSCWGSNDYGQLGDGTVRSSSVPTTVAGLSDVVAITTASTYTCALTSDHHTRCWGVLWSSEPGTFAAPANRQPPPPPYTAFGTTPVEVALDAAGTPISAIGAGSHTICSITTAGVAGCIGYIAAYHNTHWGPIAIPGAATGITGSGYGGCAVLAASTVQCRSMTYAGDGKVRSLFSKWVPSTARGIASATVVVGSENAACAVLGDGSVKCWGQGPLGNDIAGDSPVPVAVVHG